MASLTRARTTGKPDPRSGLDQHGRWTPAFDGQRPPFEPGHKLAEKHGFFSRLERPEDREELEAVAAWLAEHAPDGHPEAPLRLLAGLWVRWERGQSYVLNVGVENAPKGLLHHLGCCENAIARLMRGLAMTAEGAAQVGLQLAYRDRARHPAAETQYDFAQLTPAENLQLEALMEKAAVR